MAIGPNEKLFLPQLAAALGISGSDFRAEAVFPGGMGVCYKIVHVESGRPYALKMMRTRVRLDEIGYRRFVEELKLWSVASACDGVVEAYCIDKINELPCVCARWMPGGDLRGRLSERSPEFFYRTMDRLVGVLEWVSHEYKIIHRDLKPNNVLLDEHSQAFISDWGIARVQGDAPIFPGQQAQSTAREHPNLTQTGQFIGTIPYSSPEQILGSRDIDHRADIYSLGCMMFEWETGSPPFLGNSPEEIAYGHIEKPLPRLGGLFKRTSFGAEKTILRCLQKKAEDRFQDYAQLRGSLFTDARHRKIDLRESYIPQRRFQLPLVGARELFRKGIEGAIKGSGEFAVAGFKELTPFIREAEILCGLGEWAKAAEIVSCLYIPEMLAALPDFPLHQMIATTYGLCLSKQGKTSEAIEVIRTIASAKKKPEEFYVNLSCALLGCDQKEAECIAREGLEAYPNDIDLLGNLTIALSGQFRLTEARDIAERRLALSRDVHSLHEMAGVQSRLGAAQQDRDYAGAVTHFAEALDLLIEAKSLNASYLPSRFNLARAWFTLEEYSRSGDELNDIAQRHWNPNYAELWATQMAECMDRSGVFKECWDFCDKWLQTVPGSILLRRIRAENMADYFIGKEKDGVRIVTREALEFFNDIVKQPNKKRASDLIYLGRIKEWIGEVDEAFSLFDEAEKLQPDKWESPYERAMVYWRLQEFDSALSWAKKACSRGPWNPKTWSMLSLIQKSMGMNKEAQEYERKANAIAAKREELRKSIASRYK